MTSMNFVVCQSADGWSLHAPESTDEQIANGDAPYILEGPGRPTSRDHQKAARIYRRILGSKERGLAYQLLQESKCI